MQEIVAESSPQAAHDFAGLLATLAAAKPAELPAWSDEELPPDIALLSYERALRAHARYKSADDAGKDCAAVREAEPARTGPMRAVVPSTGRGRKCASVTLRMSETECEQLRERAAEAGLTVSAYLRLCAFEADTLRAQVKEALAELRRSPASESKFANDAGTQRLTANGAESSRSSRLGWLRRIVPDLHPARSLVRV